jgi:type I restriction enzyme S subunit
MSKFPLMQFGDSPALQIIDGDRGVHYPQKSEFQKAGHCVFLNTGNITASGFDFSSIDFISAERDALLRKGKASRHDIVLTTRGTVGNVAFYGDSIPFRDIRINSGMVLIRTDQNDVDPYYLYSFLRSTLFQKQVSSNGSGSAQPQLPISALKNIAFPHPNLNTQKTIAAVLSTLDAKIDCNNRINAELEAMAKTLYDYWFVQFDFPDANGKPYKSSGGKMLYNATLKREIPEGLSSKKIGDYAEVLKGDLITAKDAKDGSIKVVAAGIDFSYRHSESNRPKNTITISGSGANAGFINFWREPIFASDCITIRGANDTETLLLLYHLRFIQSYILSQATGSAQPHIYPGDIRGLDYVIPRGELIDEFGKLAIPMNDQIAKNLAENQQLAQLRDWLLPLLMNGQVTVA